MYRETSHSVPEERAASRRRRIFGAVGTAVVGRGSVFLVNAISVPLTVRYLGPEEYGLWVTISMTIAMLVVLDVGIASTLTNLISEAYAHDDPESAGRYFATAFWMTAIVAVGLGVAGWLLWPHIDFAYLLNLKSSRLTQEVSRATMAAGVLFLCGLPAGLAARALAGYQELHFANLFSAGGNVLALGAIVLVVTLHGSLAMLVGAYAGAILVGSVACLVWVCVVRKPWLMPWPRRVELNLTGRIFTSGGQFFVMQLAGLVVFNSDNLVISHFLSAAQVTPYNVTWRLVNYMTAGQVLLFPALWPAYSEAWARGDLGWIRSAYRRLRRFTGLTLAGGAAVLLVFGRSMIRLWAGPAAVPTPELLELMCVWMVIFAVSTNQACLMAATNRVKRQAIAAALSAAMNLALTLYWVRTLGLVGVLLGTVVSYLVFVVAVQTREVHRILKPARGQVPVLSAEGKAL
jgi:O-antigen/teichoic acid export membrane protein